jgi:hypothetical protein
MIGLSRWASVAMRLLPESLASSSMLITVLFDPANGRKRCAQARTQVAAVVYNEEHDAAGRPR